MIARTLHLEPAAGATTATIEAWSLPGDTAEVWLEEIDRWKLSDASRLRLFIMPVSSTSRKAAGLFVICHPSDSPKVRPAGLAFVRRGRSLYLPQDARLLPALTDSEVDAMNAYTAALVMHPGIGNVGFDLADELHAGDLVIEPPERRESWHAPWPGLPPLPRLRSIVVKAPPLDELFGGDAQDIGSDPSPELLKPENGAPAEDKTTLPQKLAGGLAWPFLKLAQKFVESLPKSAGGRTVWNDLGDWVNKKLGALGNNLDDARQKALEKLLDQLKNNPDEGLKHALPLGGAGQHRGTAPPSANLGNRTPNFDMGRIGGGRAADAWNVSPDYQQELRRQYMELANREVQLGRHRRAAYIYAELLGDLGTAAIVLKNGGHYAEAALIYRDHLHRPLEAAECFAAGGQIEEAVKLYEEGQRWDKLVALYRQLEQQEKAELACRSWIKELVQSDDLKGAAEVLMKELNAREEALQLLEGAWPNSRQAVLCLERALELRGIAGEHEEAARVVRALPQHHAAARVNDLLGLFGTLQRTYPDRQVKELAEDLGRKEIARQLPTVPDGQRKHLMRLLNALSPADVLLTRDTLRHGDEQASQARRRTLPISSNPKNLPAPGRVILGAITSYALPWRDKITRLAAAASSHDAICVVGYEEKHSRLVALQGDVRQARSHLLLDWSVPWEVWRSAPPPLLAASRQDCKFLLHLASAPESVFQKTISQQVAGTSKAQVGSPTWLTDPLAAAAYDANGLLWVLRSTHAGWRLSQFSPTGTLNTDRLVEVLDGVPMPDRPFPMVVTATHVVLAVGDRLLVMAVNPANFKSPEEILYQGEILALVSAPAWSSPRVAVVTSDAVHILWLGASQPHSMPVSQVSAPPCVAFTNDGALHILHGNEGMIVLANHTGKIQRWQFDLPAPAVAILPCADLWTFATIDEALKLTLWRYEGRNLQQKASA